MTTATEPSRTSGTIDIAVAAGPTSPGTTADWELFFARRALANLKSRLGQQALLELLEPDTAASAETLKAWADSSQGQWRPALTQLQVHGICAGEFVSYFHVDHRRTAETPSRATRALRPGEAGHGPSHVVRVVENLGRHISDFYITFTGEDQAVADPTNPVGPDADGNYRKVIGAQESSGQILAGLLPAGAALVKAFGTLSAPSLAAATRREPERAVLFYAADDDAAGDLAAGLIQVAGFDPVRVGALDQSIRIEMFGDLHEYGALGRVVTRTEALKAI